MASMKVQATKNYRLFTRSHENRKTDLKRHKRLYDSMKLYGFLPSFPIVCFRGAKGELIVKDGQHRLAIAEELKLTVYWIEESIDFDVALVNSTPKVWVLRDYALKFATNGKSEYQYGLDFAKQHNIPIGTAFAMLGGTVSFTNVQEAFIDGSFKARDQEWASAVAGIYGPMTALSGALRNARFLEACMWACRIPNFDGERLIQGASQRRERLVSYSTRDAYLEMIEDAYNFRRRELVPVKIKAQSAMRERNVIKAKKRKGDSAVA